MNTKIAICVILPCIIALVSCAYYPRAGYQVPQYGYQQRQAAPFARTAAANGLQSVRQARLFNYLLGGLYFLNLFNFTGNRIAG